jgi:hypothetical protein
MAIFDAYRRFLAVSGALCRSVANKSTYLNDIFLKVYCADFGENDAFICVGDGSTPRTAALFAFRTKV